MSPRDDFDPAILRGLTSHRMSRRALLRGAGATAGGLALSALLAACSIPGTDQSSTGAGAIDWSTWWADKKKHGILNFANWPYYIDVTNNGQHPSLNDFTKATGIKVNYKEVIEDDPSYYAKIAPLLQKNQSIGFDIIVITDGWYFTQLVNNGWVAQLDHNLLPNFTANADRSIMSPAYDQDALHSVVWQTGFTGLAYNEELTGGPITSFQDLLNPKFKGKIGMFSDNTEYGNASMLAVGLDPTNSSHEDWKKGAAWLEKVKPNVAKFYDQGYIQALESGDIWITQAWSGDIYQAQVSGHKHLKYVTPKEGQMTWHDNMMIPITAANPIDAITWMNYYYQPSVAGIIEDYVNYICPVPAAKEYILKTLKDPAVADSPLVFPTADILAKSHEFYVYKDEADYQTWNSIFDPIAES